MALDLDILKDQLSDPEATAWDCPCCGWCNYKAIYTPDLSECFMFSLECDDCGFDASEFGPAQIEAGSKIINANN